LFSGHVSKYRVCGEILNSHSPCLQGQGWGKCKHTQPNFLIENLDALLKRDLVLNQAARIILAVGAYGLKGYRTYARGAHK